MESGDTRTIICDNGSMNMKIGFQGQNFPDYTLQAVVGRPLLRSGEVIEGATLKDILVCEETNPYRSMLELSYPLHEGKINNWNDMELIWDYAFDQKLKIKNLNERKILLTEAAANPR